MRQTRSSELRIDNGSMTMQNLVTRTLLYGGHNKNHDSLTYAEVVNGSSDGTILPRFGHSRGSGNPGLFSTEIAWIPLSRYDGTQPARPTLTQSSAPIGAPARRRGTSSPMADNQLLRPDPRTPVSLPRRELTKGRD